MQLDELSIVRWVLRLPRAAAAIAGGSQSQGRGLEDLGAAGGGAQVGGGAQMGLGAQLGWVGRQVGGQVGTQVMLRRWVGLGAGKVPRWIVPQSPHPQGLRRAVRNTLVLELSIQGHASISWLWGISPQEVLDGQGTSSTPHWVLGRCMI